MLYQVPISSSQDQISRIAYRTQQVSPAIHHQLHIILYTAATKALRHISAISFSAFILPHKGPEVLQSWQPHDLQIQQGCLNDVEPLQLGIFLQELQCTLLILSSVPHERLFHVIIYLRTTSGVLRK
jgi:hypothetical protein